MESFTTVASKSWPLRSSGLQTTAPLKSEARCWRPGVHDCRASWEKRPSPLFPRTTLMGRRVSSWSLMSRRSMPAKSLVWQWEPTWANHSHPTARSKLGCKDEYWRVVSWFCVHNAIKACTQILLLCLHCGSNECLCQYLNSTTCMVILNKLKSYMPSGTM